MHDSTAGARCGSCGTVYHLHDCGNRFANAGLSAAGAALCPKCSKACVCEGGPVHCYASARRERHRDRQGAKRLLALEGSAVDDDGSASGGTSKRPRTAAAPPVMAAASAAMLASAVSDAPWARILPQNAPTAAAPVAAALPAAPAMAGSALAQQTLLAALQGQQAQLWQAVWAQQLGQARVALAAANTRQESPLQQLQAAQWQQVLQTLSALQSVPVQPAVPLAAVMPTAAAVPTAAPVVATLQAPVVSAAAAKQRHHAVAQLSAALPSTAGEGLAAATPPLSSLGVDLAARQQATAAFTAAEPTAETPDAATAGSAAAAVAQALQQQTPAHPPAEQAAAGHDAESHFASHDPAHLRQIAVAMLSLAEAEPADETKDDSDESR